jgi:hypothetical protein
MRGDTDLPCNHVLGWMELVSDAASSAHDTPSLIGRKLTPGNYARLAPLPRRSLDGRSLDECPDVNSSINE